MYDDENEIEQIWREDMYHKRSANELRPGDIAVYYLNRNASPQGFLHAAEIIELPSGGINFPIVLSKFADWGGEVIHSLLDVPNEFGEPAVDFTWEFWGEP